MDSLPSSIGTFDATSISNDGNGIQEISLKKIYDEGYISRLFF